MNEQCSYNALNLELDHTDDLSILWKKLFHEWK